MMKIVSYIRRRRVVRRHAMIPVCYYFIKANSSSKGDLARLLVEAAKISK